MRARWRVNAVIGLLVMLAVLLAWRGMAPKPTSDETPARLDPEITAHAEGLTLTGTDETGALAYRLSAQSARYYQQPDLWQLESPHWRLAQNEGAPWVGQATHGRIWDDATRANLRGDVMLTREDDAGASRLETTFIQLEIPEQYAETDQAVTLVGPDFQVNAGGARVWLDQERIELLDNARGQHDATE